MGIYAYYAIGAIALTLGNVIYIICITSVDRTITKESLKDSDPMDRAKIIESLAKFRGSSQRNFGLFFRKRPGPD
jgi:hypothetical protein